MNSGEELRSMIDFLNEKAFRESGFFKLELRVQRCPDLGCVTAFVVLVQDRHVDIGRKTVVMPIPPITLCWGGGTTADSACETALRKFMSGGDLVHRYIPFTFDSIDELRLKAAVFYG